MDWSGNVVAAGKATLTGAIEAASATIAGVMSAAKLAITKDSQDTGTTAASINDGTSDVLTVDWDGNVACGTVNGVDVEAIPADNITSGTLAADRIPNLNASKITAGTIALARGGTASDNSSRTANTVFAGPSSGSAGNASWRALVAADIPSLAASKIGSGTIALARGGTASDNSSRTANTVFAGPSSGSAGNASWRALVAADIPSLNASKITAGTLPIARGGTGQTSGAAALVALGAAYGAGDTITGTIHTAGYVTTSGKDIFYTIPLVKGIEGTLTLTSMTLIARQGGNYIVGSNSSGTNVKSLATVSRTAHGLGIKVSLSSTPSGVTNNDAVGIVCAYAFSVS